MLERLFVVEMSINYSLKKLLFRFDALHFLPSEIRRPSAGYVKISDGAPAVMWLFPPSCRSRIETHRPSVARRNVIASALGGRIVQPEHCEAKHWTLVRIRLVVRAKGRMVLHKQVWEVVWDLGLTWTSDRAIDELVGVFPGGDSGIPPLLRSPRRQRFEVGNRKMALRAAKPLVPRAGDHGDVPRLDREPPGERPSIGDRAGEPTRLPRCPKASGACPIDAESLRPREPGRRNRFYQSTTRS